MSSVKGWEGAIKYSNRIVNEAVGLGDNAQTAWDLDYEADDEVGIITDDATKIEVFLDGVLKTPTTDYTLDGDGGAAGVGEINFVVAPGTDVVITANYYTYATIGHVQSVAISQSNNVEPVHQIGSQLPVDLKEGNIDITLSLGRCFIGLDLISIAVHEVSEARGFLNANEFDIDVFPKGDSGGNPLITVRGKFNGFSLGMSQDAILMDSADLIGKTITVTTV